MWPISRIIHRPRLKDGKPQVDKAQEAVLKMYSNIVIVGGGSSRILFAESDRNVNESFYSFINTAVS